MLQIVMPNRSPNPSLRSKISTTYRWLVSGIVILAVIASVDLLFLKKQVVDGVVISDLKDAMLEMRREEKNLFLYHNRDAISETINYSRNAVELLHDNKKLMLTVIDDSTYQTLAEKLKKYQKLLAGWNIDQSLKETQLDNTIRKLGHEIYLTIEDISRQERKNIETAVIEAQVFLLISLFLIGLVIYFINIRFKRIALDPIHQFEKSMQPIAKGVFTHLEPPSNEREFVMFTNAFNQMLKELEIRQKRLMHNEKLASLGILSSGVAHELNNPLSNISTSCQLLQEELTEAKPEQLLKWLHQIDSETERGKKIVRTLLDFGSKKGFEKQRINLLSVINETCVMVNKITKQHNAELKINIPENLELDADKSRIQQLLINLIQNALNAARDETTISISAVNTTNKNRSPIPDSAIVAGKSDCYSQHPKIVELLISDNGAGISMGEIKKVFDPFYTTSEPGKGVGLGLYIVQEIVKEHDGCLAITSKPGEGTKVIILLPVKEDES